MIKDSAKTILCYGDSNTWGNIPSTDERYPRSVRWPGALQNLLGDTYEVISEGLCGRTLVAIDSKKPYKTGISHLEAIIRSADPVDMIIIMLGTNDVKSTYNLSADEIGEHLEKTIALMQTIKDNVGKVPAVLVICPPKVIIPETEELDERMIRGIELFKVLPDSYKKISEKYNCLFIDANKYISSSKIDGYHLDAESHRILAEVIEKEVKKI